VKAFVFDQYALERDEDAADGRFTDPVGDGDVGLAAVFAPLHQHHQQSVLEGQLGGTPEVRQVLPQNARHQSKGVGRNARQTLEHVGFEITQSRIKHTYSMTQKRDKTYARGLFFDFI